MATPTSEIFKDRRVQIGAAVVGLLVVGGGAFWAISNNSGSGDTGTTPPAAPAPNPGAPAAPGVPVAPGAPAPGAPAANPAAPGSPSATAPNAAATAGSKPGGAAVVALDSWHGAPPGIEGGGSAAGASPAAPAPGAPGAAAGGGSTTLPAPIKAGEKAQDARFDPFVTTRKFVVERIPAFTFLAPIRVASRPIPLPPDRIKDLLNQNDLRPLPPVPRRVAGVLYDGSTSAIVETGQPGPDADVRVVQPGGRVPSGIAGLADLTVSVITPTSVTLRADDGRTVTVPLSNLPQDIADQLRQQAGQAAQQGVGGPGGPGQFGPGAPGGPPPGGFGRPGGFGGGPGPAAAPG